MRCRKAQKLIAVRVDRALSETLEEQVTRHLADCRACGDVSAQTGRLGRELDTYSTPPIRGGFTERLMSRLDEPRVAVTVSPWWAAVLRPAPVVLGAAAFACGVVVPLLGNGGSQIAVPLGREVAGGSAGQLASALAEDSVEARLLELLPSVEE